VYFIKQWRWSAQFFAEWFDWYEVAIMNDQHALNHLVGRVHLLWCKGGCIDGPADLHLPGNALSNLSVGMHVQ
jgi:hypothetical protein